MVARILLMFWCVSGLLAAPQAPHRLNLQPTPLEAFAKQPTSHIVWSQETAVFSSGNSRAVITAIKVERKASPSKQMCGIRVTLSSSEAKSEVYLDDYGLKPFLSDLSSLQKDLPELTKELGDRHGIATVRAAYDVGIEHTLNAGYCFDDGTGRLCMNTTDSPYFYFPNQTPEHLIEAIRNAMQDLSSHCQHTDRTTN